MLLDDTKEIIITHSDEKHTWHTFESTLVIGMLFFRSNRISIYSALT